MDKAQPGQRRILAKDWNEFRQFMLDFYQQNGGMVNNPNNPFLITVKNVTGSDLPAFSVVKIDAAMYPDLSDTELVVETFNKHVELDGDVPDGTDGENIAIIQEDIPAGQLGKAICSGASLCYVNVSGDGDAAKSINDTENLELAATGQARVIWKQSGTGKKLAYVLLDRGGSDTRETFTINLGKKARDTRTNNPALYTKGSLHYIVRNANGIWVPVTQNESQNPSSPVYTRLVYCLETAPNSNAEYKIHYYTPEMNYGERPDFSNTSGETFTLRCGVKMGEHKFSNKRLDYVYKNGRFAYEPIFLHEGYAVPGTIQKVGIEIEGTTYDVQFKTAWTQSSTLPHFYPDIWEGDNITVKVDASGDTPLIRAIEFPVDYKEGSYILTDSMYGSGNDSWRGWEDMTDTLFGNLPGNTVISVYQTAGAAFGNSLAAGQDITAPTIMSIDNIVGNGMRIYQKTKPAADGCLL